MDEKNMSNDNESEHVEYNILFICTSTSLCSWNVQTGMWLDELTVPYYILKEHGYNIVVSSIKGGNIPIDPANINNNTNDYSIKFLNDNNTSELLNNSSSIDEYNTDKNKLLSFSGIYLVGGHGCLDDYYNNNTIKDIIEYYYENSNGCIAAICHGTIGLVNCQYKDCNILKGKFVAGFSNEEEEELGLLDVIPVRTESAIDAAGAICVPAPPWRPNCVVDRRIVTGQNPQSSTEIALRMLDVLRSLGPKYSAPENVNKPWGK